MKKIVVFALIAIMALSFTGCSKGGADYMPYGLSFGDSIPECVSKNKNFPDVNPDDGGYVSEYESISNKFFSEHFGVDENIVFTHSCLQYVFGAEKELETILIMTRTDMLSDALKAYNSLNRYYEEELATKGITNEKKNADSGILSRSTTSFETEEVIVVVNLLELEGYCTIVSEIHHPSYEIPRKHVVSTAILERAVSSTRYSSGVFSITLGELVNSAMSDYSIEYLSAEEAISKGHLNESEIDSSIDTDYLYVAVISGDAMQNPDFPYMTTYEESAAVVWMIFDESDNLLNSGVELCNNLRTCAILLMTSTF